MRSWNPTPFKILRQLQRDGLLGLIGVVRPLDPEVPNDTSAISSPFGRPSATELIEAVEEYLEDKVMAPAKEGTRFEARVARNVLGIVARELKFAPAIEAAHGDRLARLGFPDDATLAAAIRAGDLDARLGEVGAALVQSAVDQLRIANPAYLGPSPEDS